MANTRSGGGAAGSGARREGHTTVPSTAAAASPTKPPNGRETRSTTGAATAAATNAQTPNLRRSTRENKGKNRYKQVTATLSSHRSATRPTTAVATPMPMSSSNKTTKLRNTSISPSPPLSQDSNGTSTSAPTPAAAKRKAEEDVQTVTVMSKKQRRPMSTKEFRTLFNPEEKPSSPVLATSPTEDKKNTSEAHAEDGDAVLVYEASSAQEKEQANREPSSVTANKGLEGRSSDLHEVPEAILEGDELKIGSHQSDLVSEPCMRIEMCSLNKAAEIVSMLEAGEQDADDSIQNSLPELQNRACSIDHHEEASKAIEDVDSNGIQGPCTSSRSETIHCDETDYNDSMCVGCKIRETSDILKSCDGKGCKRRYHLSCMDPPLDVSLGIWLCIICTKKRLQFGVYSVSEGIESLWDVKEGVDNGKQYFVKYKNLAHVHNRWVSESDIVDSTPQGCDLISKFSKRIHKEKTIRWRQEWAEPHRLLKRRALMPPKEAESFFNSLGDKFVCCNVEWLVKWKDLGYEHATWELESSSFLCTSEAQELKRSYDNRVEAARKSSDPAKVDKVKEGVFQKLQKLPDGCPPGLDDNHLSSLNQLREFWHNSHGAVLIDDQERVIKTILFVMSILPHISQPLLIVSTSASLSLWETKFSRLAASINVVVYNGEKDVRKSIQNLEFYEAGSVMFQVLLTHPDAVFEDIEAIEQITWETVIVDDCQNSRVSKCLEQLKWLSTNFRMVLLSSSLKENIPEYINLLSFLNPEGNGILSVSNSISFDTAGTLSMLKKKLASYVAFERKADSSKFSEYWVPAHLSTVQLELYCYTLLSNSPALRSHSKTDNVGALRNILISLRKCCDHPYLVDQMLQSSLTKGHPVTDILDIGVRSCGKLLLLDKMLQKIRIEGLRVLILSQSGGGSGNPMGDILDDFIRQRFGYESYERVERGLLLQKKQTSMNMFNDKTKGRFIFLIDSRACGPSIKLSSVDAIIIYSSDWNPVNDLRALQRVTMESQSEHVPVFRLYSSCTVEEKALILAKHDHILDSNIQNITPSLSHSLLSWGASLLFNRLEECQNPSCSSKGANDNELFMDNVALEFLTKLPKRVELSTEVDNGAISKAYLRGSFYSRDIVVVGEREGISSIDGDLPKFWAYWLSLLNGRSPCWLHISEPAQRSRRKIQNMEGQSKNTEEQLKASTEETDEARIKRRRIGEIIDSSPKSLPGKNKDTILPGNNTSSSSHQIALEDTWQELERNNLDVTQKGLHIQLKPELSKLYKLLQMPENVISLCEELLEYILKNHQISQEPKGILHAFNLAMCWRAASLLKHKVNHTESLTLAMKKLNYECSEELAEYVYGKLKILKKKFAHRAGETSKQNHTASVCNISSCEQETSEKPGNVKSSQATLIENDSHQEDTVDIWTEEMVSGESGLLSDPGTRSKECLSRDELLSRIMNKRIKLVDKAFFLRRKSIQVKHANEVSSLDRHRQKEVAKLREVCSLVVEHLRRRQNHIDQEDRDGKIKRTVEWFTMLLYAFLQHMRCQRNRLEMRQSATWTKESQLKEETLQAAKSGHLDHTFDQHLPLPDSEFAMEEFSHFREVVGSCHVHAAALSPEPLDDNSAVEIASVRSVNASEVIEEEARNIPAEVPIQGPAPQTASLSVNVICGISDGSQGDAPLVVQSLEPSGGDRRSAEHVEEGTVGSPRQGDAAMEVSTGNRSTASGSSPHFETPPPSASREATFPVSREVEAQSNLVTQCAEQSLVSSQLLQGGPEQADLSGGASTQVLQSEGQQTVSVSSNLLERAQADESQPSHQTDAPPCSVQSAELRSEEQPSIPVYDNLLKRTQPDQSQPSHQTNAPPGSVQSAELRSEGQPSIPVYNDLLERTQPDQSQPIHQTNAAPGSAQSAELFPVASMMFNHPPIDAEPLKNELHKLRLHMDTLNKVHEMKKTQLRTECSIEIEKVKRKYDLLIEEQESTHLQQKKSFDGFYDKVLRNQSLAEDFRAKFISASAAQGAARVQTPPIRRTPQSSQQIPMRPSVVGSLASPSALPSAYRPPAPRPRVQAPQADQPLLPLSPLSHPSLSSSQVVQPSPLISSHLFRATSGTLSPIPPPRGNYGVQGESAPRAPAPHLQLRPPRAHSIPPGNQQQLPTTRVEITPSALAASASPPDSHLPPLGTSAMSTLHSALPSPGSKIAARPSITAGMHPSDSTSLSLDAWLTASLGLSGDAPRATAPVTDGPEVDVVCLSDDE